VMWCATLNRAMAGLRRCSRRWPRRAGADTADPHAGGRPAGPAQRPPVGTQEQLRGQAADGAHRRAGRLQR
jgi:hypothetical protein